MVDRFCGGTGAQARGAGGPQRWAMQLLARAAETTRANRLVDVTQAHVVGSYHSGPANLRLVEWLVSEGARVAIPTTLNASAADLEHPREGSQDDADFRGNCSVVDAYRQMGCRVELTCAPYHLPLRPSAGENVAWAESNAVVFANSVIGARTNMTFQYLDLAAALTGRMPEYGLYRQDERAGRIVFELVRLPAHWLADDALYPLLGCLVGRMAGALVPVLDNLPPTTSEDRLRSLGAAAASVGKVAMFHAVGITPEAPTLSAALQDLAPQRIVSLGVDDVLRARSELCQGDRDAVPSAICLGAPHYSLAEFARLAELLDGRRVSRATRLVASTSRHNRRELLARGMLAELTSAGVEVVADTCTYYGRQLGPIEGTVMTDSAKWATYAPGNLGVRPIFARLQDCVESAVRGKVTVDESFWRA